jgi:hypothetical protein
MIMKLISHLPPVAFQSILNNQWYIVTTGKNGNWLPVDRKYTPDELASLWVKEEFKINPIVVPIVQKSTPNQTYSVEGSKGKVYEVEVENNKWNCTCPAFGYGRGKECKHIQTIKLTKLK